MVSITKQFLVWTLCVLFLSFSAFGFEYKPEQGFYNKGYKSADRTVLNTLSADYNTFTYPFEDSLQNELLSYDVNNDGITEIIGLSSNTFVIFQNKTLQPSVSMVVPATLKPLKFKVYAYDGSTYLLFSAVNTSAGWMYVKQYNITANSFVFYDTINLDSANLRYPTINSEINMSQWTALGCDTNTGMCVHTGLYADGSSHSHHVYSHAWKLNNISACNHGKVGTPNDCNIGSNAKNYEVDASTNGIFRLPIGADLAITDFDSDGNKEFTATAVDISNNYFFILACEIKNISACEYLNNGLAAPYYVPAVESVTAGLNYTERSFTNPMPGHWSLSDASDSGLIVAVKTAKDKFFLNDYYWNGAGFSKKSYHPGLSGFDGDAISDPIKGYNPYGGEGQAFCLYSYDTSEGQNKLSCGTDFSTGISYSSWYFYSSDTDTNVLNRSNRQSVAYRIPSGSAGTGNILTPYGLYNIPSGGATYVDLTMLANYWEMDKVFDFTLNPGIVSPIQTKNTGLNDYLVLSGGYLTYFDDKQENQNAVINLSTEYQNPCMTGGVILVNQTLTIKFMVTDPEGDYVTAKMAMYDGTDNYQNTSWQSTAPSGSIFTFDFKGNVSGTNIKVERWAHDVNHNGTFDYAPNLVTISSTGSILRDDTTCTGSLANVSTGGELPQYQQNITMTDNQLKTNLYGIANVAGIPAYLFYLLVIIGINAVIFVVAMTNHALQGSINLVLFGCIFFDVFLFVVGALMGIIPSVAIITIVLALVAILVGYFIFLWNKISGGG